MSDSARTKLGLAIPTLNEAGNMHPLLEGLGVSLSRVPIDYELIVVDDDSSDGTAEVAREFAKQDSRVRVFVRRGQRGLAGAVLHGWAQTDANLLGVIDADLQHPPQVLPKLIEPVMNGNDIAIASRYVSSEDNGLGDWNKLRAFISRAGTLVTTPLQKKKKLKVKDPLSGFFVLRRECIEGVDLQPEGFKLLLDILVRGRVQRPVEIPFHFGLRHAGKSKADFRVAFAYLNLLGKLSRHALFKTGQR
jgi:dolichol-phosphate mannosyltransferase